MAEYINKADAIRAIIIRKKPENSPAQNRMLNSIQKAIIRIPAADVAPVVRCRKCIHWHDWGACGHPDNGFDAPPMGPDDFCSKGKRSTD